MKFILGKKIEMTQRFQPDGSVVPVTIVSAGPCYITQVKEIEKNGYQAVQVGYKEAKKLNKPLSGHLKDKFKAKYLTEFKLGKKDEGEYKAGQKITVSVFSKGDKIKVIGTSKGKGFQGVVKRHHFHGHPTTHGTKDAVRMPGSIGAGGPQHVFKGIRMAGRMGHDQVTVANLEIVDLEPGKNFLFIKGAIPGKRNSLVKIIAPGKMELSEQEEKKTVPQKSEDIKEKKVDATLKIEGVEEAKVKEAKKETPAKEKAPAPEEKKGADKEAENKA